MCRESISKAIIQKFNEKYKWECENIDELEFLIFKKKVDLKEANDLVNSIKICDPAVGSGHFLVSALNEIIAIKSKLAILCDEQGNRLLIQIENKNDELDIRTKNDDIFEYKVKSHTNYDPVIREIPSELTRIQKALFIEKKHLIENCLYGVDINQNSVMICRLRLWIELLKSAYYTEESNYTELETLPNIDINIKRGNSLISRYALDADLKDALKKSKWNITSYRLAVTSYQSAKTKDEKREMEKLINEIKSNFKTEIQSNDKRFRKLRDLEVELFNLTNQGLLFERSKKELKEWNEKVSKLTEQIKKQEEIIEEIKNSVIYKDAFEWRFEFPEVLDEKGNFVGFDVVVGNPPYVFSGNKTLSEKEKYFFKTTYISGTGKVNLFTIFLEKSVNILKNLGILSFIIPNTFLRVTSYSNSRKYLLENTKFLQIVDLGIDVFSEAVTSAIMVFIENNKNYHDNKTKVIIGKRYENPLFFNQTDFIASNYFISTNISNNNSNIIDKIKEKSVNLESICKELIFGVVISNNRDEVVKNVYQEGYKKFLEGKDIERYFIRPTSKFLYYNPKLLHRARTPEVFEAKEKLLIQRITGGKIPLNVAYDNSQFYNKESINNLILKDNCGFDIKYILSLLNSKLINWFYTLKFTNESKLTVNISKEYLSQLPIQNITLNEQKPFIEIVDQILEGKKNDIDTTDLENQIDQIVYQLYGLTEEEIKIIEGVI